MISILILLLLIFVMLPVYTYAIYPILLKKLSAKRFYADKDYMPNVTVVIIPEEKRTDNIKRKIENLQNLEYPQKRIRYILGVRDESETIKSVSENIIQIPYVDEMRNEFMNSAFRLCQTEIIIITDLDSELDKSSVSNIVQFFKEKNVGLVCGQVCRKDGKNSLFWKYENFVKRNESKIGCLSGANKSLYAFRRSIIEEIPKDLIDVNFYIATKVTQSGYFTLFDERAKSYESPENSTGNHFKQHVKNGIGNYQALQYFWKMMLPCFGSFVFVSHRVLKWFVPFHIIFIFLICMIGVFYSKIFILFLIFQMIGYICLYLFHVYSAKIKNIAIKKIFSVAEYFFLLNLALLIGFFRFLKTRNGVE